MRNFIHNNASEDAMEAYIRKSTLDIKSSGFNLVLKGETSIAEVLRVFGH